MGKRHLRGIEAMRARQFAAHRRRERFINWAAGAFVSAVAGTILWLLFASSRAGNASWQFQFRWPWEGL